MNAVRRTLKKRPRLPWSTFTLLAWRNLWRNPRRTVITLASISIGFTLSVFLMGLNDGSHNSLIRNAIQLGEGHLTLQVAGYNDAPANHKFISQGNDVFTAISNLNIPGRIDARVSLQVLAMTANNSVGAVLEGLDPANDERAKVLKPFLQSGAWLESEDERGLLIGSGMARKLKAKVGSKIVLMAGQKNGDSQAQLGRVRGIFESNIDEVDHFLILTSIPFARLYLVGEGGESTEQPVTRFALFLDDPATTQEWHRDLKEIFMDSNIVVLNWQEMMPQLAQFILLDDAGNYIFMIVILIMVVFGILNTVLMSVLERTRELGLLRAFGVRSYQLLLLVCYESFLLSLIAVVIGWILGGATYYWFATHGINIEALMNDQRGMMGTFMDPIIYAELSLDRVFQLTTIIFTATLESGIYPAIKASRITPVQALRT